MILHGHNVLEMYQIEPSRALVLIERNNNLHNWVTWQMNTDTGACSDGEYLGSLEQGRKSFERRKKVFQNI